MSGPVVKGPPSIRVDNVASNRRRAGQIFRVASGNMLEMYDFMVYGYYASAIGRAFFPAKDPFASLMVSLTTFGVGFLMRPLGALVLGAYTDRVGRRKGLLATLTLMSLGIVALSLAPPFRVIGLLAPLIVVFARLVQGFSAGAELGGVSVYLSEIAPEGEKGFYVSFQSASQQAAVMIAAGIGVALSSALKPEAIEAWGWRLPLLFGCVIAPALYILRRDLEETDAFAARGAAPPFAEVWRNLSRCAPQVLIGVGLVTMTTVSFYMITAYTPTFGLQLRLKPAQNLFATFLAGASNLVLLPVSGALSDRLGRRPILLVCSGVMLITAVPVLQWLAHAPSLLRLVSVQLWFSLLYAGYNGAMVAFLTEIIPVEVRATGFSLAYSLAVALFGGFTPAVCTFLIHFAHNNAAPGYWLAAAAACGFTSALASARPPGWPGQRNAAGLDLPGGARSPGRLLGADPAGGALERRGRSGC